MAYRSSLDSYLATGKRSEQTAHAYWVHTADLIWYQATQRDPVQGFHSGRFNRVRPVNIPTVFGFVQSMDVDIKDKLNEMINFGDVWMDSLPLEYGEDQGIMSGRTFIHTLLVHT